MNRELWHVSLELQHFYANEGNETEIFYVFEMFINALIGKFDFQMKLLFSVYQNFVINLIFVVCVCKNI